ncbi:chromosomal replication initiator DnaA [Phenylobacterium sp.]|uniref:chromosomal replication initiator DnaA n=1 Tax=Phenylobacterium sp. TaxID=1871053 RepID=UPI002730A579|nr:chromosomal replication initiator DnaA [Phenylobacterium sp.]MDP1618347.1 chromosomal replication initiator DnaA [Phenylobacterium sp.]MDP1989068.1 chromosomal replication initiator DnaA [Phenylobacterium sp.]
MARQLRLKLRRPPSYDREAFAPGPSNAAARAALTAWPAWHGGALVLVGPEGVGKTHLASLWAQDVGARRLGPRDVDLADAGPVLIEDVDQGFDAEFLFHRINMAGRPGAGLLLTARTAPAGWPAELPDLRSRLNALQVAEIEAPDDEVLEAILRRQFARCNITPHDDVIPYILRRIERSAPAAWEVVRRLDAASGESHRPVSRVLARQVLETDTENLDLFE